MKRVIRSIVLVSVLGLTACSSSAVLSERAQQRAQIDQAYVSQVETLSRSRSHNLRVFWVNPPVKKTPETDTPDN